MSEDRIIRINKVLRELNISLERAVDYLKDKGIAIDANPNAKISEKEFSILQNQFAGDKGNKEASKEVSEEKRKEKEALRVEREKEIEDKRKFDEERQKQQQEVIKARGTVSGPKQVGTVDLNPKKAEPATTKTQPIAENKTTSKAKPEVTEKKAVKAIPAVKANVPTEEVEAPVEDFTTQYQKLSGATLTGQVIDLSQFNKPKKKKEEPKITPNKPGTPGAPGAAGSANSNKNKRKRIAPKPGVPRPPGVPGEANPNKITPNTGGGFNANRSARPGFVKGARPAIVAKVEPTEEEVKNQIRETLEKLQGKGSKSKAAKYRRDKRDTHRQKSDEEQRAIDEGSKTIKVTEFVTVGEIAIMMDVPITKVIGTCMSLGIMVTMNQRLDAETLTIVADEFGYEVEFITVDIEENIQVVEDKEEDLAFRAPIVTVMGHVDHGKTSLLDYIRKENVIAGESGGITQHIGAYGVTLDDGQKIAFLDTPGHEAFTAMRARGAQVTDIAIIVIAADDDIMPQTKEAISHAQAANVPIIFAINKIDKDGANPDRVREGLSAMNILVEEWGGKYQCQEISAKKGLNIEELLVKVSLEAELLELKANANKNAKGAVLEAKIEKGRGVVASVLISEGTLKVGDALIAGQHFARVKAMFNERGQAMKMAGPSSPVSILGFSAAPAAGETFQVLSDEAQAKEIANKREQLQREQSIRTTSMLTLDTIGKRLAIGNFQELKLIIKADVDGSSEALSDSLLRLSTDEIEVKIIQKSVGPITDNDVLLAKASDAIVIGFQVRPMPSAKKLAENEGVEIKQYSIIYQAIEEIKAAMEGMLAPDLKEEITGTAEVREVFKITKVGTIAGCMQTEGKMYRSNKVRLIRNNVVIYTGEIEALKRFKDDAKEIGKGFECGIQIKNYNDLELYDLIEGFREVEVARKLS